MYKTSDETKRKVYEMFDRNEEMVEDDVKIIKEWLKTQPHLPEIMEDVKIKNFLNLNKFSIERTKQKIDMYYTIRTIIPDFFDKSNPKLKHVKHFFDITYVSTLPNHVDGSSTVLFIKAKEANTFNPIDLTNAIFAIFEVRLYEDFMVNDIIIFDMATFALGDFKKLTPTTFSKCVAIYEKVYSLRLKKLVYLNCPPFVPLLAQLLKSILKPKIFDRVQFHQNAEILKEILPKDYIPKDFGGIGPSLKNLNEMMENKFAEYKERFDQLDNLRVNEALRPQKLNNDEILGYYGNFKKLNVD